MAETFTSEAHMLARWMDCTINIPPSADRLVWLRISGLQISMTTLWLLASLTLEDLNEVMRANLGAQVHSKLNLN